MGQVYKVSVNLMNIIKLLAPLTLLISFSSLASECAPFFQQTAKQSLHGRIENELESFSVEQLSEPIDYYLAALKYRYGIGVMLDFEKSNDLLETLDDSNFEQYPDMITFKYYFLGSYYYACADKERGLNRLWYAAEKGDPNAKFLYLYISYNAPIEEKLSFDEYLRGLAQLADDGYKLAGFEHLYQTQVKEIDNSKSKIWASMFSRFTTFETCDLMNFYQFGAGVDGLVVDWSNKAKLIYYFWPDYYMNCLNKG